MEKQFENGRFMMQEKRQALEEDIKFLQIMETTRNASFNEKDVKLARKQQTNQRKNNVRQQDEPSCSYTDHFGEEVSVLLRLRGRIQRACT